MHDNVHDSHRHKGEQRQKYSFHINFKNRQNKRIACRDVYTGDKARQGKNISAVVREGQDGCHD